MVLRSESLWKLVLVAVRYFHCEVGVCKLCVILVFHGDVASLFRVDKRLVTSGVNEILGMEAPLSSESSCVDGSGSKEGESKKPDFIHVSSNRRVGGLGGTQLL